MKRTYTAWCLMALCCLVSEANGTRLLVEGEHFQFPGYWHSVDDMQAFGGRLLLLDGLPAVKHAPLEALTAIRIPAEGRYRVWIRTRDFPENRPQTRRFKLALDNEPFESFAGTHGKEGFHWECMGERRLEPGEHLLALREAGASYARCDAVYLTTGSEDPESEPPINLRSHRIRPSTLPFIPRQPNTNSAYRDIPLVAGTNGAAPLAQLATDKLRVEFHMAQTADGRPWIIRDTRVRLDSAGWIDVPGGDGREALFLQHAGRVHANCTRFVDFKNLICLAGETVFNGKRYSIPCPTTNPFEAAPADRYCPARTRQLDANCVEIIYTHGTHEIRTVWSLDAEDPCGLRVAAFFRAPKAGSYSLGFSAGEGIRQADVSFLLLPPLYQFQRLPDAPQLIPNTLTPHPIALVERKLAGHPVTSILTAELDDLPFVWAMPANAACGLTLQNAYGQVQPGLFAPILGTAQSQFTAGEERTVRWRLWSAAAGWKDAFTAYCLNNAKVRDYREPVGASLTEAILNMADLLMNDEASGWEAGRRGFYDIETATMVKHAAPLALLEAATLSRDEEVWRRRGRPSLEFMLSRKTPDLLRPDSDRTGQHANNQLAVPGMSFGYSGWRGATELLRGNNPWLADLVLPPGAKVAHRRQGAAWSEMLAAARLRPGSVEMESILEQARNWCEKDVFGRHPTQLPFVLFYNISFYPEWWNLDELETLAPEARWPAAAFESAFLTMAGQWSQPRIPKDGEVTVHPDGCDGADWHLWFKDRQTYRLGWPRHPGDTPPRRVPAWQVSNVGLGFEQPSTYAGSTGQNILQSTWAPHLLRLSAQTNGVTSQLLRTFARNAVIGRFANYPGYYYISYNDLPNDPQFPYKGPDLSSIYYHHIPVHYAWSVDYLVAEMEVEAQGAIAFPWVVQKNYAWFNNRVYTPAPGRIYGDTNAVLWLARGLVTLGTPAIDWLAARSPEKFWLMLLNQTPREQTFTCRLNAAKIGLASSNGTWTGRAENVALNDDSAAQLTLPPNGFAAISWPAKTREEFPAPQPLAQGHRRVNLAAPLGEAHAFTIRSPWNHDSLYVVLTTDEIPGVKVEFTCGHETQTRDYYPYEATFETPAAPNSPITIRLLRPGVAPETIQIGEN